MLPIGQRALFNGVIEIKAQLEMEPSEHNAIDEFLKKTFGFVETRVPTTFPISHRLTFKDSVYESTTNVWSLKVEGKRAGRGRARWQALKDEDWLTAANFIERYQPKIVYFPSALLEFPDRIILDQAIEKGAADKNAFYCEVVGDILRSINPDLNIDTHLVARAKSGNASDRENLSALLLQIEHHLKATVFKEWESIFGSSLGSKDFRVLHGTNESGQLYIQLRIQENAEAFSINERSAGFRWFFAFILLTKYRLSRKDRVLFLFDEPANNLHPNAQTQLLKSLELLSTHADIIYSTHSHYLINPLWLESTHIVSNAAVDEASGISLDAPARTAITVTPYRTFVGSHPEQYFYYRPVMEALDYSPSPIEFPDRAVLIEGKTDFFLFEYMKRRFSSEKSSFVLFPGGGAGSLDSLVTLLSGWGKRFVILVDSDQQGEKQKKRYLDKFESLVDGRVFSLADIDSKFAGKAIESLLSIEDMEAIRNKYFPELSKIEKKHLHVAVQEMLATRSDVQLSAAAQHDFASAFIFFESRLEQG